MKEINCNIYYTKAGEIDYERCLDDGTTLSKECLKRVNKIEDATGIVSSKKMREFNRKRRKEEDEYISEETNPSLFYKPEETRVDTGEIDEEYAKRTLGKGESIPRKDKIIREETLLEKELKEHPYLKKGELIEDFNISLDDYSQAKIMTDLNWITKYGKMGNKQVSNTRTAKNIDRLPIHSFGSIAKYDVDTLPDTLFKCKGTEITQVSTDNYIGKGKHLPNRTTFSNILSYWCYALGLRYLPKDSNDTSSGLNLWGKRVNYLGINQKETFDYFISGKDIKTILLDIIYLTRNNNPDTFYQKAKSGRISNHLFNKIEEMRLKSKTKRKEIIQDIKKRIYYIHKTTDLAWAFPKYSMDYLISFLTELTSGKYFMDIMIPLVKNRYKYPIECKDTRIFPLTEQQHEKNTDDYDISQYIWERE